MNTSAAIIIFPHSLDFSRDNTYSSFQGIDIVSIQLNDEDFYEISFYNTNEDDKHPDDNVQYITSYSFEWYLSYSGNRVSDYYTSRIRCGATGISSVYSWPGKVPKGHEKYVTVQFGREPVGMTSVSNPALEWSTCWQLVMALLSICIVVLLLILLSSFIIVKDIFSKRKDSPGI